MDDHIKQARAAVDAVADAEAAATAARAKLNELLRLERTEQAERETLREREDEAEALRQLDGEEAVPVDKDRLKRLAALDKSVPARTAAIRLQRDRVDAAEVALRKTRGTLATPALHLIVDLQREATESIRSIVAQLAPDFARLIASDQIRAALLGDRFPVPEGCPVPIGGSAIVAAFNKALPDRLKPAELVDTLLHPESRAISAEIINQIKG